jgi:hypothetical protein
MNMDPKEFLDVPLNSKQRHGCSPAIPSDPKWRGVIIRAPRQVWFKPGEIIGRMGAFAAIPICAYHLVDVVAGGPPAPIILVATNRRTGQVFSGPITESDPSPRMPPPVQGPPLTARQVQGLASGGYFNPNLADFVPLPQESATYDIHVEFREFKSNVVTVELIETPP